MGRRATRTMAVLAGVAVTAPTVLAGCSSGSGDDGADDPQGSWVLVEGTGPSGELRVPEGEPITLVVEGTDISGFSGCNTYSSEVATAQGRWRVQQITSTEKACDPLVDAFELQYLVALRTVDQASVDGDTLTLEGRGTTLTYEADDSTPDGS